MVLFSSREILIHIQTQLFPPLTSQSASTSAEEILWNENIITKYSSCLGDDDDGGGVVDV